MSAAAARLPIRHVGPRVETSTQVITPTDAERLLAANQNNRPVRPSVVTRYAADMKNGDWHVGTGAVVIDREGNLLDGQHRLLACVEAGKPFSTVVIEGVEPETKVAIDQGIKRTMGDMLGWRGEASSNKLAAAVRAGWVWSRYGDAFNRKASPTADQTLEWLERNPSIRDALREAGTLHRHMGVPAATGAVMLHRTRLIEPEMSELFFEQLRSGADLKAGDPALALRNWLTGQAVPGAGQRPVAAVYHFMAIKAWNAVMLGKDIKVAKYVRREEFPRILDGSGQPASLADETELNA